MSIYLAVLFIGACTIFGMLLTGFLFYYLVRRQVRRTIQSFFVAPSAEKPSEFAKICDAVSQVFAARLLLQLKTTVMGMNSVEAKRVKGEQLELIKSQAPPLLQGLASVLPAKWAKDPNIMAVAASILGGMGGKGGNGHATEPEVTENLFKL